MGRQIATTFKDSMADENESASSRLECLTGSGSASGGLLELSGMFAITRGMS